MNEVAAPCVQHGVARGDAAARERFVRPEPWPRPPQYHPHSGLSSVWVDLRREETARLRSVRAAGVGLLAATKCTVQDLSDALIKGCGPTSPSPTCN